MLLVMTRSPTQHTTCMIELGPELQREPEHTDKKKELCFTFSCCMPVLLNMSLSSKPSLLLSPSLTRGVFIALAFLSSKRKQLAQWHLNMTFCESPLPFPGRFVKRKFYMEILWGRQTKQKWWWELLVLALGNCQSFPKT